MSIRKRKKSLTLFLITLLTFGGLSSCIEDIDKSNLYVFNGTTIIDFLKNNPEEYSEFTYILTRIGYDKILATYGNYTCFVPNNAAVSAYVDSLYNDMSNPELPRNGMTAPGLEGLTDSLCTDIALYHLLYTEVLSLKMNAGATFSTVLGRDINTSIDSEGHIVINSDSRLYEGQDHVDLEMENGIVHKVSAVFTRSNNMISGELMKHEEFSLFNQALAATGLVDTLTQSVKNSVVYPTSKFYFTTNSQGTKSLYTPQECKIGFTVFAETDEVLHAAGITDWNGLVQHAKDMYADCAQPGSGWYDYYRNNGIAVSTGNDYENPNNALNMWVRYHIVKAAISNDHLAYHNTDNKTAETPAVNYFETLLPKTLIRVSLENRAQNSYKINQCNFNSSLTDGVATTGSKEMHTEWHPGVEIEKTQIQAMNGYIHPIKQILVYNQDAKDAFNERMRFDVAALFGEMLSNGLRHIPVQALGSMYPEGYNNRIRFPNTYFDNFIAYTDECNFIYLPVEYAGDESGPERRDVWEADEINIEGAYDCALRLPPVPDGIYEIRLGYKALGGTSMSSRGMMQIFLGDGTNELSRMEPLDIPLDMRRVPSASSMEPDAVTGWINPNNTEDNGLETDVTMRYLNFMRAPIGMLGGTGDGRTSRQAGDCLRRILTTRTLHQGDYWLRFKRVLNYGLLNLDYIEIVPLNVYDNAQYREDMF